MTIISPSILAADFLNLKDEISRLDSCENLWIHLDIMDGHFVPNLTFGAPVINKIKNITKHKLDAHLMVTNPEEHIEALKSCGLHNFTFHWEAVIHHDRFITHLKSHFPSVGISLNPSTEIKLIPEYIFEKVNLVLIMSVNPGFGGQSFIESSKDKIKYLQNLKTSKNLNFEIQVDGGVTDLNSKELIKCGATNLVAGSFIFGDKDKKYVERINLLRSGEK